MPGRRFSPRSNVIGPAPLTPIVSRAHALMNRRVHLILSCWIASHLGHAVLSTFYETAPASFVVPVLYAGFVLLTVAAWKRSRGAAKMCAIAALMTVIIQGLFIWKRDAYGALSIPVLVFDILGIASSLLYLVFFFSSSRERYLSNPDMG